MASGLSHWLVGQPFVLAVAVAVDLVIGDPPYAFHPIRLIGWSLTAIENRLRRVGADGYGGGVVLFVVLAVIWVVAIAGAVVVADRIAPVIGWLVHAFFVYSLLALGDLLRHVWRVETALTGQGLPAARLAIANLVGRDTARMDGAACRRAAVESLSENLTDGFISPLFWYGVGGLPTLVLFKVVSTMDSMVGYKTPRYLQFGWCGARLDDAMNYVPSRLTWLLITAVAVFTPGCSARKAWSVGLRQHAVLPGPNSGWSEAAAAGAIARKLVGPIWIHDALVTGVWIGDSRDPPLETRAELVSAMCVVTATAVLAAALVVLWLYVV